MNNLKQMGIAVMMYAHDNDGFLPVWKQGAYENQYMWYGLLLPYVNDNADIFVCPSAKTYTLNYMDICYGKNYFGIRFDLVLSKLSRAKHPSKLVVIGDSCSRYRKNDNMAAYDTGGQGCIIHPTSADVTQCPHYRHSGRTANFLFADGHVEALTEPQAKSTDYCVWGIND